MGKGRSAIFIQTIHLPKSPAMLEDIQELGNVMCYCGYIFGAVGGQLLSMLVRHHRRRTVSVLHSTMHAWDKHA